MKKRQFDPFKRCPAAQPKTPAIMMCDPRYPHNVGAAVRACSCFGVDQVWITGKRTAEKVWKSQRLPREERMKGFSKVDMILEDRPFNFFPKGTVPIAVELLPGSENIYGFEHPDNAVYVFGPEDGSIPPNIRGLCHRRIFIPTQHCVNLGAAVYLVLNDRKKKRVDAGLDPMETIEEALQESRGFTGWPIDDDAEFER